MNKITSPFVDEISDIKLMGPVIHYSWFNHLKLASGETDFIGVCLLGVIVSKYTRIFDPKNGSPSQKFSGEVLSAYASALAQKVGVSCSAATDALNRLQDQGLISLRPKQNEHGKLWI